MSGGGARGVSTPLVNNIPTVKQNITGIVVSHAQKIIHKKTSARLDPCENWDVWLPRSEGLRELDFRL